MKIKDYRSSFTVFILDASMERSDQIYNYLKKQEYDVHACLDGDSFFKWIQDSPPHIVFLHHDFLIVHGEDYLEKLMEKLPEVHVILYTSLEDWADAAHFYKYGIYDCVAFKEQNFELLLKSADRAAETDYYIYMNEQLKERERFQQPTSEKSLSQDRPSSDFLTSLEELSPVSFNLFSLWYSRMVEKKTLRDIIDEYLKEFSRVFGGARVVFFKFIPSHQSLVISQSFNIDQANLRGIGYDLYKEEPSFRADLLSQPEKLLGLKKVLKQAFQVQSYYCLPLIAEGTPEGIFVALDKTSEKAETMYLKTCLKAITLKAEIIQSQKRFHTLSIYDDETQVLNKNNFIDVLGKEMTRARRLTMPVSLILLSLDNFSVLQSRMTSYELELFIKMCANIIKRHSRVNDIIGRVAASEFAIALPHTGRLGVAIKAERLRMIFESGDFSRISPRCSNITVSIGASEYPSHCRDVEDIMRSADEALHEAIQRGKNKVCIANAPENFIPDFVVERF